MAGPHTTREVKVRNDVLKLLYATMLVELSSAQVKAFWRNHPYKLEKSVLEDGELLRHIWDESQQTDLAYLLSVFAELESFLTAGGIDTLKFIDKFIVGLNKGSIVGAAAILGAFAPFLKFLFSSKDVVHFATERILPFIVRKLAPTVQCEMVKHSPRPGYTSSVVLLNFSDSAKMELPPYDPYLFAARPLLFGPLRIGMAPLDEACVLSDTREVETIVQRDLLEYTSRGVSIAKRHVGSFVDFVEYCKRQGLSLNGLAAINRRVLEVTESYFCPVRKREVLFKGCVYGAPFCLIEIGYKNKSQPKDEFLEPIIHESTTATTDGWRMAAAAHDALLRELERKIVFVFNKSHVAMSINGRRLVKFAPALILHDVIRRHVATGKTEFTNRDFTSGGDESGPMAQNFSLRLQRLASVLSEKCPEVSIRRSGRGLFCFEPPCKIELIEE